MLFRATKKTLIVPFIQNLNNSPVAPSLTLARQPWPAASHATASNSRSERAGQTKAKANKQRRHRRIRATQGIVNNSFLFTKGESSTFPSPHFPIVFGSRCGNITESTTATTRD
ncbi:hypothetical protein E2C01_004999 [Portunus trituberculatus]|uniref:Uncharacterized protein n=1 Tax=Portunus trituberculatus TaxID=210409 RepID=A0A5B7CXX6_PORTR|nr:hypothetical protein [Portunus trituberculatus]